MSGEGGGAAVTALPVEAPRLNLGSRLRRNYDITFPLGLLFVMLIVNLLTENTGFGLTEQLATAAPLIIAGLASSPAVIGAGSTSRSRR